MTKKEREKLLEPIGMVRTDEVVERQKLIPKEEWEMRAAVGKDDNGELAWLEFHNLNNLAIAGMSGQGKSNCMSAVLAGIAARYTPGEARLYIAERQHMLKPYAKLPHCDGYADDSDGFWRLLSELGEIIRERIDCMHDRLQNHNELHPDNKLPHIIVVIDDFDFLADYGYDRKKKEALMQKLWYVLINGASLGIHVVASMSTPIRNPFCKELLSYSSRITLAVRDWKESVSIVEYGGGEYLFERGAGLLYSCGRLYRIKFGYAAPNEIDEIVESLLS